jgi:hypothetical protein
VDPHQVALSVLFQVFNLASKPIPGVAKPDNCSNSHDQTKDFYSNWHLRLILGLPMPRSKIEEYISDANNRNLGYSLSLEIFRFFVIENRLFQGDLSGGVR